MVLHMFQPGNRISLMELTSDWTIWGRKSLLFGSGAATPS